MSEDLSRTENLLETHRPTLDDASLSRVRSRVEADAARRRTPSVVIVALLTLGFAFSAGGTGLAVSGLASDTTAVQAQYPPPVGTTTPASTAAQNAPAPALNDIAPTGDENEGGVAGDREENDDDAGGVAGEGTSADDRDAAEELAAVSEDDELPFTGWAAVPIMLLGLAMLAAGLVLRRRTNAPLA